MAKIQDGGKTKFDVSENSEDVNSEGKNNSMLVAQLATSPTHGTHGGLQNLQLNAHKAGMQGLDTQKINEIIQKASEGSRFYLHKQKQQKVLDEKINEMKQQVEKFSQEQIQKAEEFMNKLAAEMESERDLTHTIVHVDMDMFYAAVEMRDDPRLRDKPMAVGGTGMLSTSNYAARKYGVRAAMPGFIGKKLCPELIIVPPDFTKYKEVSKQVQEVFAEYDPNFSPMSLDEAFIDITKYIIEKGEQYEKEADNNLTVGECIVEEMRRKIHEKTQLTASAGIACNTRLAKVCSDLNKPNGQFYLPPELQEIHKFVEDLAIRKVCGIGNVMEQHLAAVGITKCGQLWEKRGILHLLFSEISYTNFITIALGLGHNTLGAHSERERKSISCETTFKSTQDAKTIFSIAEEQCQELSEEMQKKEILGKVFTLKIKTADFQIKSRSFTLPQSTNSYDIMISATRRLLQKEMETSLEPLYLRLLGVRMSSLIHASEVGSARQATITQLFSRPSQKLMQKHIENNKKDSSNKTPCDLDFALGDMSNVNHFSYSGKEGNSVNIIRKEYMLQGFSEVKEYECPVCKERKPVSNLFSFNKHVDKCLEESNSDPSSDLEQKTACGNKEEPEGSGLCNSKYNIVNELKNNGIFTFYEYESENEYENYDEEIDNNPNIEISNLKYVKKGDSNFSDDSNEYSKANLELHNRKPSACKASTSAEQSYICPVCQKQTFSNISNLNTHVDECLNQRTITKLLESHDSGTQNSTNFITQPSLKRKFVSDSKPKKKRKNQIIHWIDTSQAHKN